MTSGLPVGYVGGGGGKQSKYKHLKMSKLDLLSLSLGCEIEKLVNPRPLSVIFSLCERTYVSSKVSLFQLNSPLKEVSSGISVREKKKRFSLIHKVTNRWHTLFKTVLFYICSPANGP